ncbi:MAG TPA: hypothetical protein VFI47_13970 [Acidimicrobiales bacterium]|nr:hypothetical protein [Acidimicrobiales bacterium]
MAGLLAAMYVAGRTAAGLIKQGGHNLVDSGTPAGPSAGAPPKT